MKPYTALLIVPTGIGASIGGYAGDALPVARALAATVSHLITHPNVLNGACLCWPMAHVSYVEGYGLDRFCRGDWGLQPARQNRVAVLMDAGIEPDLQQRHIHVMQAAQATLGLEILTWAVTQEPLGISVDVSPSGSSQGVIERPDCLIDTARQLMQLGAEALAVVSRLPDDLDFSAYEQGRGVDPLAGVEALVSHLVVRELQIPCAHAPAFRIEAPPVPVHPRAAAEEVGFTFLPSVLVGLSYAPRFIPLDALEVQRHRSVLLHNVVTARDVDAVIAPASAFGGPAVLHLASRENPPLMIAVEENTTLMAAYPRDLRISALQARSYLEAIGIVAAHRAGVSLKALSGSL